jgi:hypothetical protein
LTRRHTSGPAGRVGESPTIALLDARNVSGAPAEALDLMLERLEALPRDAVLKAELGLEPGALAAALVERGFGVEVGERERGVWPLEVRAPAAPRVVDLRDLEAPEPLQRILQEASGLPPAASLLARVPRFPRMLLPQLEGRGLSWEVYEERDGTALVCVRRAE